MHAVVSSSMTHPRSKGGARLLAAGLALGGLLAVVGCETVPYEERKAGYEARLWSFVGGNVDALVLAFGPPTEQFDLSQGGRMLQWSESRTQTSGGDSYTTYDTVRSTRQIRDNDGTVRVVEDSVQVPVTRTNPISTNTYACTVRWRIRPDNMVDSFTWQGNSCF